MTSKYIFLKKNYSIIGSSFVLMSFVQIHTWTAREGYQKEKQHVKFISPSHGCTENNREVSVL